VTPRLYPHNLGFEGITSSRDQRKQVIAVRLSRIHSGGVLDTYTLTQDLKYTCVLMLMVWCSPNAHGMVQEECSDAMPSSFNDLSKNAQY
jgi:hypothetical protein